MSQPHPQYPQWLHRVGQIESLSLIVLVNLAMPLKYLAGQPELVRYCGMLHGVLFMVYMASYGLLALKHRWPLSAWVLGPAMSVLPFGYLLVGDYLPTVTANAQKSDRT